MNRNHIHTPLKALYSLLILGMLLTAFYGNNVPIVRAQQMQLDTGALEERSTVINNSFITISYIPELENVLPSELRDAIEEALINRPSDKLKGDSLIVTAIRLEETWGFATIVSSKSVQTASAEGMAEYGLLQPDKTDTILFVKTIIGWKIAFAETQDFVNLVQLVPVTALSAQARTAFMPRDIATKQISPLAATNLLFPWRYNETWILTKGWHSDYYGNNALDFAPSGSTTRDVLSVTDATVIGMCGPDDIQVQIRTRGSAGDWYYLHLDKNQPYPQIGDLVPQGAIVGKIFSTPGSFGSSCGNGTGPHVHLTAPSQSFTIDGWTVNSSNIWMKSGYSNKTVGSTFPSTNGSGGILSLTLALGRTLKSRPVTIELRTLGPQVRSVFTGSPTPISDVNGNITNYPLTNVSPGTYTLLVKPQGWLRKEKQVTLVSGSISFDLRPFAGGDINGDNVINIVDIGIAVDNYNTSNLCSDLNRDGSVDIIDIGIIIDSYGQNGGVETHDVCEPLIAGTGTQLDALNSAGGQLILTAAQPSGTAQVGEIVTLNLDYDTAALAMAGVSAMIDYDECVLQPLIDQITTGGIFPRTGTVPTPGTLEYHAYKWVGELPVSGTGRVASIPFRVIASVPSSTTVAIRFRPGSSYYSTMDQANIHQPFLDSVNNVVLYPTGNPPRPAQSAQITSPLSGETINQNFALLQAQASDACHGLHQVTFSVFYDGQWHVVGTDTDGTDGWSVYWDASQVADQVVKVKAFAGDFAGNGVETPISDNVILDRKTNILFNGGFEVGDSNPLGWQTSALTPSSSTFLWDSTKKHSGNRSVEIANSYNNDARWIQTVFVQPNSDYILSGWIKTLIVQHSPDSVDVGANLSIMGGSEHTDGLIFTNDWTYVNLPFNSGSRTQVDIAARLGMYSGTTIGIAWFDDLKLEPVSTLMCYTLTKSISPSGSGNITADPAPNCNNGTEYVHGTVVKLTATPNTGYNFGSWSGDAIGSINPTYVTMIANKSATALFNDEQILNGGFNTYPTSTSKIPTSWRVVNFSTTDGKSTTVKREGTASVRITGTGVNKTLSQTLLLSGSSGDAFNFSFWVKGKSIPTVGVCRAQILFYNGTTLNPSKPTINCVKGTYSFNQKSLVVTAPGNYTKIIIRFTYTKASGQVWLDAVSLSK